MIASSTTSSALTYGVRSAEWIPSGPLIAENYHRPEDALQGDGATTVSTLW
jgi:hypothetical protein